MRETSKHKSAARANRGTTSGRPRCFALTMASLPDVAPWPFSVADSPVAGLFA